MGKRSTFERVERDFYPTPPEAVIPLLPHLESATRFAEPCAGDGALVRHLEAAGHECICASDIEPLAPGIRKINALDIVMSPDAFITNPPWHRSLLHPLINYLSNQAPTWLLFDADWAHTVQASGFRDRLKAIVSVGRVKWIADSKHTGKDNAAWYLFDAPHPQRDVLFFLRTPACPPGQQGLFA